jgi:hypothetical protein
LVAGREKDLGFADALLERKKVDAELLLRRIEDLPVSTAVQRRIREFIERKAPNLRTVPQV